MPPKVLNAYKRYREQLQVHNTLAAGLGDRHTRLNGIPQGCPFSMMLVALLLRPWILLMESIGTDPRTLADDLLVTASGPNHLQLITQATNQHTPVS